jgi:hypothetical protein
MQCRDQHSFRQANAMQKISRSLRDLKECNATNDGSKLEVIETEGGPFDMVPNWDEESKGLV